MKKLSALMLTVVLMLSCLTACDLFKKDKNVTCEKYENCAIFTFDDFSIRATASFELERTGLGEGAIYYQANLEEGALSVYYKDTGLIHQDQRLGEFTADDEMPAGGSGGYVEGDKITITFKSDSPVSGEIIIAFTEDALKAVHGNLHHHEHTCTYTFAGKAGHFTTFTCGCPSEHETTPHYDGDTDYLCDYCKCDMTEFADEWQYDETHHWYVLYDEAVYCYGEHANWDADLFCDVCGFNMSEITTPTNYFLRNQAGCEWLNEITAEDIAEIKIIDEYVGVAPGNLKNILGCTDEAVIVRIFEEYYWLDTAPIPEQNGQIAGGSAVTVKLLLKDGTEKELYINNGNYRDTDDNYFELLYTPKFEDTDNVTKAYGFITYRGTGTVSDGDNNPVCEIPIDELEFVELPEGTGVGAVVMNIVETEFANLIFASNRIFYFEGSDEGCYELIGKNLDELIAEYSLSQNI